MKNKYLTPRQAIRKFCTQCRGGLWFENGREILRYRNKDIADCTSESCPLYPLRFGKQPIEKGISPMKQIRAMCRECIESLQEIKNCTCGEPYPGTGMAACPLYIFRFGRNFNRKGIGRIGGNPALKDNLKCLKNAQTGTRKVKAVKLLTEVQK
ncbi:MAG: hypothetical protein ABIH42_02840 [Planctomycetota bacterium]